MFNLTHLFPRNYESNRSDGSKRSWFEMYLLLVIIFLALTKVVTNLKKKYVNILKAFFLLQHKLKSTNSFSLVPDRVIRSIYQTEKTNFTKRRFIALKHIKNTPAHYCS